MRDETSELRLWVYRVAYQDVGHNPLEASVVVTQHSHSAQQRHSPSLHAAPALHSTNSFDVHASITVLKRILQSMQPTGGQWECSGPSGVCTLPS